MTPSLLTDLTPGIEAGMKADEIVLLQMGVAREDELTEVQRRYKDKFVEKLKKVRCDLIDLIRIRS